LRNEKGVEVSEWLPTKIHQDVLYRLRALYHSDGYLRVAIHDEADEKLWDSGEVPTYGRMNISRLRFSVRDGEGGGAALRWDADNKAVFMRAVGWHSSHVMEGHITHLALDVYDR
jgi:hypothetical protein